LLATTVPTPPAPMISTFPIDIPFFIVLIIQFSTDDFITLRQ